MCYPLLKIFKVFTNNIIFWGPDIKYIIHFTKNILTKKCYKSVRCSYLLEQHTTPLLQLLTVWFGQLYCYLNFEQIDTIPESRIT